MSDSDGESALVQRRQKPSAFAAMIDDSDSDSDSGSDAPAPVAAPKKSEPAAAPAPAAAKGKAAAKKGAKGKKGKGGDDDEEDLDALLNELGAAPAPAPAAAAPAPASASAAAPAAGEAVDAAAEYLAKLGVGGGDAEGGASKKKKKKGKGGKGDKEEGEEGAAAPTPAPAAAAPAPAKKLTGAAKLAAERQAAVRAAEEERARLLAEQQREEEEERAREEEEERKRTEERDRRKAKEKAKKEAALKDGTYMTKKQKEDLLKARARLGLAAGAAGGEEEAAGEGGEEGREMGAGGVLVAQKKGVKVASLYADANKKKKGGAAGGAPSEASPMAADGSEAAEAAASEAASTPAAAEAAPAAAAAAPAESWEEAVEDWEQAAESWEEAADAAPAPKAAPAVAAAAAGSTGGKGAASAPAPSTKPAHTGPAKKLTRQQRMDAALAARSPDRLRSPICCVLGHVDTGKTSLLDKVRSTNVQEGEAGGITQQIGATYFPMDRLASATDKLNKTLQLEYKVPGLLIIDTPGHEQFTNLRSRGSGLCDIAVLVVDIMHGLERQTIESINLLRQRRTPFVVALNKVDRMYGWKPQANAPIRETLAAQADYAQAEFETRTQKVLVQLAEQGLNASLYYDNKDFRRNVSVVPTSAVSGEGIPDLLMLIVQLTQQLMSSRLMYQDFVQATVLDVKTIDGLGTTVDVVLVNGELREGDTIVVCGMEGPIVTQIRALLTPPPLREMRIKSEYVHHKSIEAAMGVKISAQGLDKAVAGTSLLVAGPDDDIDDLRDEVQDEYDAVMKDFKRDAVGVHVQASTLGSLEALLEYLRAHSPPVPVASVGLGPLHKKDIVQSSVMHEHRKEYATVLAFDVKVTPEAAAAAEHLNVRIFAADIIYHLTDQFDAFLKAASEARQKATLGEAVFPVVCKVVAAFNTRTPLVLGCEVLEGRLKIGTPLCVVLGSDTKIAAAKSAAVTAEGGMVVKSGPTILDIGRVTGIEHNHTAKEEAVAGGPPVAVKIETSDGSIIQFGRHFEMSHTLYAHVTRESINVLKENFRDALSKPEWKTVIKLKQVRTCERKGGGSFTLRTSSCAIYQAQSSETYFPSLFSSRSSMQVLNVD